MRPDLLTRARARTDLIWRGGLVVAAAVCTFTGAPTAVTGSLVLASLVLVAERVVRLRRLGGLDALLLVVGGLLVTLVLLGIVLGSTAIGLRPTTWSVGLTLVAALGIVVSALHPRPAPVAYGRQEHLAVVRAAPWLVAALVVVVVAVTMSARSVAPTEAAPVEMSLGTVKGTSVDVTVSASAALGPLEVRTTSNGNDLSYPLFTVDAGQSVTTQLALPATGRYVITLNYPDQAQPLRTLTLDR